MSLGAVNYGSMKNFREKIKQWGLSMTGDKEQPEKIKYSFFSNALILLVKQDEKLTLDNFGLKEKCLSYLSKHNNPHDYEWRKYVNAEKYFKKFEKDENCVLCDDLMVIAFCYAFEVPLRIFEHNRVITLEPNLIKPSQKPLLIGRITNKHYVALKIDDISKVPKVKDDVPFKIEYLTGKLNPEEEIRMIEKEQLINIKNKEQESTFDFSGKQNTSDDFSDDDEVPLYDQFVEEPTADEDRTSGVLMKIFTKVFKLLSYFLFFGLVFFGALISKSCMLVLSNAAKPESKVINSNNSEKQQDFIRIWAYIFILVSLLFPEALTIMYSLFRYTRSDRPSLKTLIWSVIYETIHAFGQGIIFFIVLPRMDSTAATIFMSLVGFFPSLINLHAKWKSFKNSKDRDNRMKLSKILYFFAAFSSVILIVFGILITILIGSGLFGNTWKIFSDVGSKSNMYIWAIVGIILMSFRFWENFITSNIKVFGIKINSLSMHEEIDECRFKISLVSSFVKSGVLIGMMFLTIDVINNDYLDINKGSEVFSDNFFEKAERSNLPHREITRALLMVFFTQAGCSLAAFYFGRIACMTMVQIPSYSLPLAFVTPVQAALCAVLSIYKQDQTIPSSEANLYYFMKIGDSKTSLEYIGDYIDWNTILTLNTMQVSLFVVIGVLIAQGSVLLLTLYIWYPEPEKIARTEALFLKTIYAGPMIDQVMMLNKRNYQESYNKRKKEREDTKIKKIV